MVNEFKKDNFDKEVIEGSKTLPVIVDFFATWCGPCKLQDPIMEELAKELSGKAVIGKINVDEKGELATKYEIMSVPTTLIFKDGQVVETLVGLNSKESIKAILEKYL